MAILRGFPPSNTISPSVRITEKDFSLILPNPSFHRAGIVGFASKGPINIPTLITSTRSLHVTFGFPHPQTGDPYLIYAGEQYLSVANELYVVRVAVDSPGNDEQAMTASVAIPASGPAILVTSKLAGPYVFATNQFFRWRLNGILASKMLVVLAGTYTTDQLVASLNAQLTSSVDGITFSNVGGYISVGTTFSYGPSASLEFVSCQSMMVGGASSTIGLGLDMTQAVLTGTVTKYPNNSYQTAGNFDFTGLTGLNLQVVIEGTDSTLIDDIVQVIDFSTIEGLNNSITTVVNTINSQASGFLATAVGNNIVLKTLTYGEDSSLLVKSSSTAAAILGLGTTTVYGSSTTGVSGAANANHLGIITGATNASTVVAFTITADSPGIEGNGTQVVVGTDTRSGTFSIGVYNNGQQIEQWGNLTKDSTSTYYVATYLQQVSSYIRATDNVSVTQLPTAGTYSLSGGTDGIPFDPEEQDNLLIGSDTAMTGMQALSDPEQVDIDLICVPGHPSTDVVVAMLDLCQNTRADCFAIIDPPFGLTVQEIIDWQNGVHPLNLTRFDSDFGALYWPWVRLRDTTNQVDVWVPPSGSVLATYARSDTIGAPWEAPAGLTRGVVPNISNVFSRPSLTERDLMYGYSNAINPIVQFQDITDYVIWGQKTLQRAPTALDRVNVRRMLLVAEKRIRAASRGLLFEPHDDALRQGFIRICKNILDEIKTQRGLTDYLIQCDTELNTPDVIDRNEMRARVGIQPTRAAEFIFIEFAVFRTGSFSETADSQF